MKNIFTLFSFISISFLNFAQVEFSLTGNCQYAGNYEMSWADQFFWDGSGDPQNWNTPNLLATSNALVGNLVLVQGVNADTVSHGNCMFNRACNGVSGITNVGALNGNFAVIRRGGCEFGAKALAAQNAGAIACIIVNAVGDPVNMGAGADGINVTIPTIMVSANTGAIICDAILAGCNQAFIGNKAGFLSNNLSCKNGDVYRPNRAMDATLLYENTNDTYEFTPGALIRNLGTNAQSNISVTCEIFEYGTTTPIYAETSPTFNLSATTFDGQGIPIVDDFWVAFSTPFQASGSEQSYQLKYSINTLTPDDDSVDNFVQAYFGFSESKLSYAQIDPQTQKPIGKGGAGPNTNVALNPTTDYWMICNHVADSNLNVLIARGTYFQAYTYDPIEETSLTGKIVECIAYEWTNSEGNYDISSSTFSAQTPDTNQFTEIMRGEYFYSGNYQDSLIYVGYYDVVYLESDKHYLFCNRVNVDGNLAGLKGLNFRLDSETDYTTNVGGYWNDQSGTGIPASNNGNAITTVIEDGTFYSAGYGFDKLSNSVLEICYYTDEYCGVGLNESEKNRDLTAYPNPTVDIITVPFGNVTGTATINIIDVAGRVASTQVINLTGGNVNIDVTHLESGIYHFDVLYANGSKANFKVVVSK